MTIAIEVTSLVKTFGRNRALDGLDLTVESGQVHGFLGPNGAGKSTTIRIVLGLMRATAGTVRLLDGDPWATPAALHKRLAYVPGDVTLWPNLSGGEIIDLLTRMRGKADPARRAELIDRFELDPRKRARTYSTGNRQKVALVAAFASDVELLILDEPTSGLDPLMEAVFKACVREATESGRTVLLSSHILSEVEELCDHVTIVRSGRTVESGNLASLRSLTRTSLTAEMASIPSDIAGWNGVHDVNVDGTRVRMNVDPDQLGGVVTALGAAGLAGLVAQPPTLEELFMRHYHARNVAGTGETR
ncbi:ABC transporter ATP-binding protein [Pseudoclavibacter endophyticus]|uniref:ABC transporter ATP-binding protein n=1 Tax=Pseudoclavibacter endophyticus TaxID=1778590 RepID=A0A6H9WN86_9MICO|nr:ABC transporter ATP-binding protein [Pseudoclavibacter endophyticus]KAB1646705.1 ABC transporter ATP-binding protein [Pseudoclavibacter endophyticus]GGA76249.1 ABC transporter ATP-binding protein [Pseudoclavibacter endophyticus]